MRRCPFCGSNSIKLVEKVIKATKADQRHYYVRCNSCFARGPVKDIEAIAIMAWDGEDKKQDSNTGSLFERE